MKDTLMRDLTVTGATVGLPRPFSPLINNNNNNNNVACKNRSDTNKHMGNWNYLIIQKISE